MIPRIPFTELPRSEQLQSPRIDQLYGRFYGSEVLPLLKRVNEYLSRWVRGKYMRLRRYPAKARTFLAAALLAEAVGVGWGGVALEERQRDRAIDVGEHLDGTWGQKHCSWARS